MSIIERDVDGVVHDGDDNPLTAVPRGGGGVGRWLGMLVVLVVVSAVFGLVMIHALLAEQRVVLDDLEVQLEDALVERDRLTYSVARLESPSRVIHVAVNELGMISPEEITYLTPPAEQLTSTEIRNAFLGRGPALPGSDVSDLVGQ